MLALVRLSLTRANVRTAVSGRNPTPSTRIGELRTSPIATLRVAATANMNGNPERGIE